LETNTIEMVILIKYDGDLLREKKLLTTCCPLFKQALKKNLIGVSNYDLKDLKIYLIDTLGYAGENNLELYELPISYCPFCGIKFRIKSVLEN
jgi:hypothetical protein